MVKAANHTQLWKRQHTNLTAQCITTDGQTEAQLVSRELVFRGEGCCLNWELNLEVLRPFPFHRFGSSREAEAAARCTDQCWPCEWCWRPQCPWWMLQAAPSSPWSPAEWQLSSVAD